MEVDEAIVLIEEFNCRKGTISNIKKNKKQILTYISMMEMSRGAKKCKAQYPVESADNFKAR